MGLTLKYGATNLGLPNASMLSLAQDYGFDARDLYRLRLPAGLSRWGTFKCIIDSSNLAAIQAASPAALDVTLSVADDETETFTIDQMYLVDARPIDPEGAYHIIDLCDARWLMNFKTVSVKKNMLNRDGTWDEETVNEGDPYTLDAIVDDLFTAMGATNPGVVAPLNAEEPDAVVLEYAPAAMALDCLLYTFGLVCMYDPRNPDGETSPTFSIDAIGEGKADLATFNSDDASDQIRTESQASEKAIVPGTYRSVHKTYPGGEAGSATSTSGRPTDYLSGAEVAVPCPSYATGTSNTTTGSIANRASAYYTRFDQAPTYDSTYIGVKLVPMVHALDMVEYVFAPDKVWTVARFSRPVPGRRPPWAIMNTFGSNAHGGIVSRIDAFGRVQVALGEGGESVGVYPETYHKMITQNQAGWGRTKLWAT